MVWVTAAIRRLHTGLALPGAQKHPEDQLRVFFPPGIAWVPRVPIGMWQGTAGAIPGPIGRTCRLAEQLTPPALVERRCSSMMTRLADIYTLLLRCLFFNRHHLGLCSAR
jgi:hypothetical protein